MFCKNCGNEIENGAKFCNNCGAPQEATPVAPQPTVQPATSQQTVPQYNSTVPYNPNGNMQPPVQAKKSNKGCIVAIIIAVVLVVLIVIGVVALIGFGVSNTQDTITESSTKVADNSDTVSDTPSDEFSAIFTDNYIVQAPHLFLDLDSRAFACIDDDGMIEKMEFGYKGDEIKELFDTIYYPTTDYTDDMLAALDKSMKETFSAADELDCCEVTYETTSNYYIITIHSTDLDNALNLKQLSDANVLTYDGFALVLSMEDTADGLIAQGYVER